MSPRRRKAEDADVFAAMARVMRRVEPAELALARDRSGGRRDGKRPCTALRLQA